MGLAKVAPSTIGDIMPKRSCLAIILAAGEGTRMKSATPKVLHKIAGLPMLGHVVKAAEASGAGETAVVIGPGMEAATAFLAKAAPVAETFIQAERLGTGHAVLAAKKAIAVAPTTCSSSTAIRHWSRARR